MKKLLITAALAVLTAAEAKITASSTPENSTLESSQVSCTAYSCQSFDSEDIEIKAYSIIDDDDDDDDDDDRYDDDDDDDDDRRGRMVRYTTTTLSFRSAPKVSARRLAVLRKGTRVNVISCSKYWCSLKYKGKFGYAAKKYLRR